MSIIATNSYRYNYEMNLWCLKNYTAGDLLDNWDDIYRYALSDESEENVYFLADCLDVLNEKVQQLSETDRMMVMERTRHDLEKISIGENVLRLAG